MAEICIIPARGGSKRIPGKNIKEFLGKPIIGYSIEVAIESGLFDQILVSTDDEEIAQVAMKYGATVPFLRSVKNSDDHASTSDVLEEVLLGLNESGLLIKNACCLYPTAPFVTSDVLKKGRKLLVEENMDTVFPIARFSYPIWRGLRQSENGLVDMVWEEHLNSRSQDLESVFHDAGQWYWFNAHTFLQSKRLFTSKTKGIELSPLIVQDIDNEHDWHLAELKFEYLQSLK